MSPVLLLATLATLSAPAEGARDAVILSGDPTAAEAQQKSDGFAKALASQLQLPPGFPRVVDSGTVAGLRGGFQIVVLGYCPASESKAVLAVAKQVEPGAYLRHVTLSPAQLADAACPQLAGAPSAGSLPESGPAPMLLVKAAGDTEASVGESWKYVQTPQGLVYAAGYPRRVRASEFKLGERLEATGAPPPRPKKSAWLVVLGVCPADRALATLAAEQSFAQNSFAVEVAAKTPLACPQVTREGAGKALQDAVRHRDIAFLRELLALQPPPRSLQFALEVAVHQSDLETLQVLLAAGARPDGALLDSLMRGEKDPARLRSVALLLLSAGVPADAALEGAISSQPPEVLQFLLEHGASAKQCSRCLEWGQYAQDGEAKVVLLLAAGATPAGGTSLAASLTNQHLAISKQLLAHGASSADRGRSGLSVAHAVMLYRFSGERELQALLFDGEPTLKAAAHGDLQALGSDRARLSVADAAGWTPLHVAAALGQAAAVERLLASGVEVAPRLAMEDGAGGQDPLALAVMSDSGDAVIDLLLAHGAPLDIASSAGLLDERGRSDFGIVILPPFPNAPDPQRVGFTYQQVSRSDTLMVPLSEWGSPSWVHQKAPVHPVLLTPLGRAAWEGRGVAVRKLLAAGAKVDQPDGSGLGLTPLMLAAGARRTAVVQELLAAGASLTAVDAAGNNALMHALAQDAPPELVTPLLGPQPRTMVKTPRLLTVAMMRASPEIVGLLLGYGAGARGEGKKAAKALCPAAHREYDGTGERIFGLLDAAGYASNYSGFLGPGSHYCYQESEGD